MVDCIAGCPPLLSSRACIPPPRPPPLPSPLNAPPACFPVSRKHPDRPPRTLPTENRNMVGRLPAIEAASRRSARISDSSLRLLPSPQVLFDQDAEKKNIRKIARIITNKHADANIRMRASDWPTEALDSDVFPGQRRLPEWIRWFSLNKYMSRRLGSRLTKGILIWPKLDT